MLQWRGKRPFTSTSYYPAQEKEQHGEEVDGWLNKIFWGDNIQVMSHLLKEPAKFSFGTNNFDPTPKDLSRWLEAIVWLDLNASDVWTPAGLKR